MVSGLGSLFSPAGRAGRCRPKGCVWGGPAVFRPHWVCLAHGCVCFPRLHCSGPRLLYMERALHCARFQFSGPPQKRGLGWACVWCLPRPEQLRQPGLPGALPWALSPRCGAPSPLRGPSLGFHARRPGAPCVCSGERASSRAPPGGCRPSRISGSLWLEAGGLFAGW